MPLAPETIRKVLEIVKDDQDYARSEDVRRLFGILVDTVQKSYAASDKKLSTALQFEVSKALGELKTHYASEIKKLGLDKTEERAVKRLEAILKAFQEQADKRIADAAQSNITDIDALWALVRATPDNIERAIAPLRATIKDDSPKQLRDKLETLEDEERLDVSAIKGIEDFVKRHAPKSETRTVVATARSAVQYYDLSSQLDGAKTTFALPAFNRVVLVQSTSFPTAFRPTVDYTTDASAMTITFTSQIDPAMTLAAGQSLIILYAEN